MWRARTSGRRARRPARPARRGPAPTTCSRRVGPTGPTRPAPHRPWRSGTPRRRGWRRPGRSGAPSTSTTTRPPGCNRPDRRREEPGRRHPGRGETRRGDHQKWRARRHHGIRWQPRRTRSATVPQAGLGTLSLSALSPQIGRRPCPRTAFLGRGGASLPGPLHGAPGGARTRSAAHRAPHAERRRQIPRSVAPCALVATRVRLPRNRACPQARPSAALYRGRAVGLASDVTVPPLPLGVAAGWGTRRH
jgi:hypothetical protein